MKEANGCMQGALSSLTDPGGLCQRPVFTTAQFMVIFDLAIWKKNGLFYIREWDLRSADERWRDNWKLQLPFVDIDWRLIRKSWKLKFGTKIVSGTK